VNVLDNQQRVNDGLRELALFAGAGGGILGGQLLGWRTVCAVEIEPYAASVLVQRQNDGILSPFPIWDDVCTFDGNPWRGIVDVVSGGFPCQDISSAGKGAGITGERSGLWKEFARIIGEVRPRFAFVENSPVLTSRGLGVVLGDLAEMGYDAEWGVLGAHHAGAPHKRDRIWILAYSNRYECNSVSGPQRKTDGISCEYRPTRLSREPFGTDCDSEVLAYTNAERLQRKQQSGAFTERQRTCEPHQPIGELCKNVPDTNSERLELERISGVFNGERSPLRNNFDGCDSKICDPPIEGFQNRPTGEIREAGQNEKFERSNWWTTEPRMGDMVNGLADGMGQFATDAEGVVCRVAKNIPARVDRLKALGNGQVPPVAALAFKTLIERINTLCKTFQNYKSSSL
jgi:DNA (cytosine-5)-methyltransferase 1